MLVIYLFHSFGWRELNTNGISPKHAWREIYSADNSNMEVAGFHFVMTSLEEMSDIPFIKCWLM